MKVIIGKVKWNEKVLHRTSFYPITTYDYLTHRPSYDVLKLDVTCTSSVCDILVFKLEFLDELYIFIWDPIAQNKGFFIDLPILRSIYIPILCSFSRN